MTLEEYHDQWARHNAAETDELRRDNRIMRAMLSIAPGVAVVDEPINHVAAGRHARKVGHHDVTLTLNGGGMKDVEKQAIIACGGLFNGNWAAVARKMKISRNALIRKRRKLGLMKFTVKAVASIAVVMFLAGCSTPTTNQPPVVSPVIITNVPIFIPEIPVARTVNISPRKVVSTIAPQASVAPEAVSVPPRELTVSVKCVPHYDNVRRVLLTRHSNGPWNWTTVTNSIHDIEHKFVAASPYQIFRAYTYVSNVMVFAWDASPTPGVSYRVSHGRVSGQLTNLLPLTTSLSRAITNLPNGTNYIGVRAVESGTNYSAYANQLVVRITNAAPRPILTMQ